MQTKIEKTQFGSITIDGCEFEHDVILRLSGKVKKRKKKLSKRLYGTSHVISLDKAGHVFEKGVERLIVVSGQGAGRSRHWIVPCDLLRRARRSRVETSI